MAVANVESQFSTQTRTADRRPVRGDRIGRIGGPGRSLRAQVEPWTQRRGRRRDCCLVARVQRPQSDDPHPVVAPFVKKEVRLDPSLQHESKDNIHNTRSLNMGFACLPQARRNHHHWRPKFIRLR